MRNAVIPLIAAAALLAGCTTALTPQATHVQLIHPPPNPVVDQPNCYQFLGHVEGSSSQTGMLEHKGFKNAINEMLNKAAKMGADVVVLSPHSDSYYWTFSEEASGQAYRYTCAQPPSAATAAQALDPPGD